MHHIIEHIYYRAVLIENRIQALYQRHFHATAVCLCFQQAKGIDAFGHLVHRRQYLVQRLSPAHSKTYPVVAGQRGGAGYKQVPYPGQTEKSHRVRAHMDREPRHFGQGSSE